MNSFLRVNANRYFDEPLSVSSRQAQNIVPMLFHCWFTVDDAGPNVMQHWVNTMWLLGFMIVNCTPAYDNTQKENNILNTNVRDKDFIEICVNLIV